MANRYEMDRLSLMKGRSLQLTDKVSVIHPTLGQIEEKGYGNYQTYLSTMISTSLDVADILWFEMQIWYEDIKDEWSFFIQKCISSRKTLNIKVVDEDGKLNYVEDGCLAVGDIYRDSLNYFLGLEGEYLVLEQTINNIKQTVLYNGIPDEKGNCYINNNSFKFTQFFYDITRRFLMNANWISEDYEFTHGGNKRAKKYILEDNYNNRKRGRIGNESNVSLDSIVSSLIAKGHTGFDIWDYPIYLVYDQYYRWMKVVEYHNTIDALHNGCLDTKKNPISWSKINWSGIIKH